MEEATQKLLFMSAFVPPYETPYDNKSSTKAYLTLIVGGRFPYDTFDMP